MVVDVTYEVLFLTLSDIGLEGLFVGQGRGRMYARYVYVDFLPKSLKDGQRECKNQLHGFLRHLPRPAETYVRWVNMIPRIDGMRTPHGFRRGFTNGCKN